MFLLASAESKRQPPAGGGTPTGGLTTRSRHLLMADENPTGKGAAEHLTPATQDLRDQAVVLTLVLSNWPAHLGLDDLTREIATDPGSFADRDRVERAVRDLVDVGLALRGDAAVVPSRAALRFSQLEEQR